MTDDVDEYTAQVHRRDAARMFRLVLVIALIVVVVALALDNREDARLGYVFGDAEAPTWTVIVAAAVIGVFAGWLIRHRPRRRV